MICNEEKSLYCIEFLYNQHLQGLILGLSIIKLVEIFFVFTTKAKRQISRQAVNVTKRIKKALGIHKDKFVDQIGAQFPAMASPLAYSMVNSKLDFVPDHQLEIVKKPKKPRMTRKPADCVTDKK